MKENLCATIIQFQSMKINIEILVGKQNASNGFNRTNKYRKIKTTISVKTTIIEIIVAILIISKIIMSLIRLMTHLIFFQTACPPLLLISTSVL